MWAGQHTSWGYPAPWPPHPPSLSQLRAEARAAATEMAQLQGSLEGVEAQLREGELEQAGQDKRLRELNAQVVKMEDELIRQASWARGLWPGRGQGPEGPA